MRFLILVFAISATSSCTKEIKDPTAINGTPIRSENGVFLLPCHSTTFTTNYPVQAGKVPPFRFTKTHYPSGRVRTINMLSRANPIHAAFKPQAWELIGTFTYNLKDQAYFVGTKQLWEYYKTSTGAAARRSVIKKNVSLTFYFQAESNPESTAYYFRGSCDKVYNNIEKRDALRVWAFPYIQVLAGSDEPEANYNVDLANDDALVIHLYQPSNFKVSKKITFKYKPGVNWQNSQLSAYTKLDKS